MKDINKKSKESAQPDLTKNKSLIIRLGEWSLNHFFKTFIILLIINFFFFTSRGSVPIWASIIAFLLLTIYIIIFVVKRIHTNITKLLHHELKFNQILTAYITSVMFIIILFSMMYWGVTVAGKGYLKYGSCIDTTDVTRDMIANDPLRVDEVWHYPYFSAMTFFTVGYGDICPMGMSKTVAILDALAGNAFTVLILAMAITNYSTNKNDEEKKKKEK
jgi:hypothetical protein